jgi:hypothetical protein
MQQFLREISKRASPVLQQLVSMAMTPYVCTCCGRTGAHGAQQDSKSICKPTTACSRHKWQGGRCLVCRSDGKARSGRGLASGHQPTSRHRTIKKSKTMPKLPRVVKRSAGCCFVCTSGTSSAVVDDMCLQVSVRDLHLKVFRHT